jgi:purine-cytosine permease-like protein
MRAWKDTYKTDKIIIIMQTSVAILILCAIIVAFINPYASLIILGIGCLFCWTGLLIEDP